MEPITPEVTTVVQIGYGQLLGFIVTLLTLIAIAGPVAYHIGRTTQRVAANETAIAKLFEKIDEIYRYIKNGKGGP